jgi:hypothetical protein
LLSSHLKTHKITINETVATATFAQKNKPVNPVFFKPKLHIRTSWNTYKTYLETPETGISENSNVQYILNVCF